MNASRKEGASEIRVVVEVDGKPVGFLNLDIERLWPLLNHRTREVTPIEWIDPERYETVVRATVAKKLMQRLQPQLYQALGAEIVKAELDAESVALKAEAAAQAFGRTRSDIEKLAAESGRTPADFYAFFWEYLLDDRESTDLRREWKINKLDNR